MPEGPQQQSAIGGRIVPRGASWTKDIFGYGAKTTTWCCMEIKWKPISTYTYIYIPISIYLDIHMCEKQPRKVSLFFGAVLFRALTLGLPSPSNASLLDPAHSEMHDMLFGIPPNVWVSSSPDRITPWEGSSQFSVENVKNYSSQTGVVTVQTRIQAHKGPRKPCWVENGQHANVRIEAPSHARHLETLESPTKDIHVDG